jgi:hypothetical protein
MYGFVYIKMIENFSLQSKVFVDLDQMIIIEEGGKAVTFVLLLGCRDTLCYQAVDG